MYSRLRTLALRHAAPAVLIVAAAATSLTGLDEPLNRVAFFEPYMAMRARLGLAPPVSERLALVVLDDRSLATLAAWPDLAFWQQIARTLEAHGSRRFLLLDVPFRRPGVATDTSHERPALLFAGAAAAARATGRTTAAKELPAELFLAAGAGSAPGEARPFVVAPTAAALASIQGLGDLSPPEGHQMKTAIGVGAGRILPALPLHAAALSWSDDGLTVDGRLLATSPDGTVYLDYPNFADVLARTVSVSALVESATGEPRAALDPKVADLLQGVETVLLVPNGHSGARFVEAPERRVPSYVAALALSNSIIRGETLRRPLPAAIWLGAAALLLAWMSRRVAPTLAFKLGIGMAIGALVVGIGALAVVGWVLPVVPLTGLGLLGATLSASRAYLDNERQRSALARDLALGETVQSMLLPQARSGQIGPWRYRLMFRPLGPMSGDWFQVFEGRRPDGEPLGVIAVGDVIGKGPSAALTTAAIAAVWSEHKERWAARDLDTSEFCQLLHRVLCGLFSGRQNTSLSLAVLEPEGVTYAAVAAPSWIEIAPRQAVCELLQLAGSDPIGMQDEPVAVETASWNGRDGELLVAATDGIFADRGSLKRLRELSLSLGARLEPKALDEVLAKLASEARHPDDATALVITRA